MPVITSSSGFLFLSAVTPVFAAAAAISSPRQIEAWTLFGATIAMFLAVAFAWIRAHKVRRENVVFTALSAVSVGWLLPEPLAWTLVKMGWLAEGTVEGFPAKLWALLGLACGLSGTTLVLLYIHWSQNRLPGLILKETEGMAEVGFPGGAGSDLKQIRAAVEPGSNTKS